MESSITNYWWWRNRLYQKIGIDFLKNRRVLDVGCGAGDDAVYLAKYNRHVVGFDETAFPEWKFIRSRHLNFIVADAHHMPFRKASFDGIYIKDVLHHVADPEKVMSEIMRVARPGAHILIVEANRYNPITFLNMTLLQGHNHFSFSRFKKFILATSSSAQFHRFDSHYLPVHSPFIFRKLSLTIEWLFEHIWGLSDFPSYNVARIIKRS